MELRRKKLDMPDGGWIDQTHFELTTSGALGNWKAPRIFLNHDTAELWLVGKTNEYGAERFNSDGFAYDDDDITFDHSSFWFKDFLGENSIGRKTYKKYKQIAFGLTPNERHKAAMLDEHRAQVAEAAMRILQPGFAVKIESVYVEDGGPQSPDYRLVLSFEGGAKKKYDWSGPVARDAAEAAR